MLVPHRRDLASQGKARGRICGFWDGVHELLHSDEAFGVATAQVFQMNAGKGVGILLAPKALVKR